MKKYTGLVTLEFLEDAKKYNTWVMDQFLPFIKGSTMEIGAGIGNITNFLTHLSPLHVSDIDASLIAALKKKLSHHTHIRSHVMDITKSIPTELLNHFENVVAINVLEHIKNDMAALQGIHSLLRKNGKVFLLVPAKKFAYTKLDVSLGHVRRYEKKELEKKLLDAGFTIESLYYFNPLGLVAWMVRDKIDTEHTHLKSHHVKVFEHLVPMLRPIQKLFPPPIGISLIARAKKI